MSIYQIMFIVLLSILILSLIWLLPVYIWFKLCVRNWVKVKFWRLSWIYIVAILGQSVASFCILLVPVIMLIAFTPGFSESLIFTVLIVTISAIVGLFVDAFLLKKFCKIQFKLGLKIATIGLLILYLIYWALFWIRYFFISPFRVFWPSMEGTFNIWDLIVTQKINRNYNRWDIVVFRTEDNKILINRIAWLPGETIRIKDGKMTACEEQECESLDERYLQWKWISTRYWNEEMFYTNNWYFLIWDNDKKSLDSRWCFSNEWCIGWKNPEINKDEIKGKVYAKIWPKFELIK